MEAGWSGEGFSGDVTFESKVEVANYGKIRHKPFKMEGLASANEFSLLEAIMCRGE